MENFKINLSKRLLTLEEETEKIRLIQSFYEELIKMGCDDESARKILVMQSGWVNGKFISKDFTEAEQQKITSWAKYLPA